LKTLPVAKVGHWGLIMTSVVMVSITTNHSRVTRAPAAFAVFTTLAAAMYASTVPFLLVDAKCNGDNDQSADPQSHAVPLQSKPEDEPNHKASAGRQHPQALHRATEVSEFAAFDRAQSGFALTFGAMNPVGFILMAAKRDHVAVSATRTMPNV